MQVKLLKGVQRPAAFAIVCFCFCEFRTVSYSGSCAEQVADCAQSMLVFVLPLSLLYNTIYTIVQKKIKLYRGLLHEDKNIKVYYDYVISLAYYFAS